MTSAEYVANLEPSCRVSCFVCTPEKLAEVIDVLDPFDGTTPCWDKTQTLPRKPVLTAIVKRALTETVTDIGQLTHDQRRELTYAVKYGVLERGKGGPFPILKTVYAVPGLDFAADREHDVAEMRRAHMLDLARGTAKFFPWVPFQR